ncbi:Hypp5952 [Branchiostoma lanceolatum]|uniref:Hypp5952 protein n=1 Tax=Branchiostoma lanceolatum TaxID=7740 RepID=A0A8J9VLG9_BRALA|nr:Hypp5952 [Branchiostoma lanceolatum]
MSHRVVLNRFATRGELATHIRKSHFSAHKMGRKGIFVVALLSLACFSTLVAGQNLSASFYETLGYYTQLALSKSIDWNTTMDLRDSGQVQQPCYDQSVQLHTDMQAGKSYAIQMLDSSGKFNPTGLF